MAIQAFYLRLQTQSNEPRKRARTCSRLQRRGPCAGSHVVSHRAPRSETSVEVVDSPWRISPPFGSAPFRSERSLLPREKPRTSRCEAVSGNPRSHHLTRAKTRGGTGPKEAGPPPRRHTVHLPNVDQGRREGTGWMARVRRGWPAPRDTGQVRTNIFPCCQGMLVPWERWIQ